MDTSTPESASKPLLREGIKWAFSGDLLSKVAFGGFALLAGLKLGVAEFGQLFALQAVGLIAASAWDLGFSALVTREVAAGARVNECLHRALHSRVILLPFWAFVFSLGVVGLRFPVSVSSLILVGTTSLVIASHQLTTAVLRGSLKFRAVVEMSIVGRWTTLAMSLVALTSVVPNYFVLLLTTLLIGECVSLLVGIWRIGQLRESDEGSEIRSDALSLGRALPFALTSLMQISYNRLDLIIVAAIANPHAVGAYALASRVQDAALIIPTTAYNAFFPIASRRWSKGDDRLTFELRWISILSVAAAVGLAIGGTIAAPVLLPLLGRGYAEAVRPVQIILWSVPLIAFNSVFAALHNARRRSILVTGAVGAALSTALLLNLLLTPRFGAIGASMASTFREIPPLLLLVIPGMRSMSRQTTEEIQLVSPTAAGDVS